MTEQRDWRAFYDLDHYKSLQGQDAISARIKEGRLPIMDIAGIPFFIDVRLGRLRPLDAPGREGIDLDYGGMYNDKTGHSEYYIDTTTYGEAILAPRATSLPKNVVFLSMPHQIALDPVGMARKEGFPDETFLSAYPLVMYQTAKLTPLENTLHGKHILRNKANAAKKGKEVKMGKKERMITKSPARKRGNKPKGL
jgi:hypothetical protein